MVCAKHFDFFPHKVNFDFLKHFLEVKVLIKRDYFDTQKYVVANGLGDKVSL